MLYAFEHITTTTRRLEVDADSFTQAEARASVGRISRILEKEQVTLVSEVEEVSVRPSPDPVQMLADAAPELLAALEAALELGAYRGDRMPIKAVKPIFDAMKAAIAKAKGETL